MIVSTFLREIEMLAYLEAGSGPPLVLLHAFPLDSAMWLDQSDSFSESHRVITPDLFGFGATPPEETWSMDSQAVALAELLDSLMIAGPVTLGGLSMGGYVALAFAKIFPHRIGRLILADTRADGDSAEAKLNRDQTIRFVEGSSAAALIERQLPKMLGSTSHAERPNVVERVRELASRQSVPGVLAGLKALRDRPDSTGLLETFDFPTLVIVGEDDAIAPPSLAEVMVKELKSGKLVRIPGAGHLSNLEQPELFNAAIRDFLGG